MLISISWLWVVRAHILSMVCSIYPSSFTNATYPSFSHLFYYKGLKIGTSSSGQEEPNKLVYRRSQKGKLQLSYNGFYYCKEKTIHEKEYWRCIYYTTKIKCHGRLHVVGNQVFRGTSHNHVARRFKRADYKRLSEILLPDRYILPERKIIVSDRKMLIKQEHMKSSAS